KPVGPGEDTLDACRVRCDNADSGKADSGRRHVFIHTLEPVRCHLSGTSSHVGQDDLRPAIEMIDKGIQAGRSMNVDLGDRPIEEMLERATGFVLCVQVEQGYRNLVCGKPFGQGHHDARLANAAFAAHCENHALRGRGLILCCLCHRTPPSVLSVRGSFSRKTNRERFASCAVGLALNAARRSLTGSSALGSAAAGSSNCTCFRWRARTLTKE